MTNDLKHTYAATACLHDNNSNAVTKCFSGNTFQYHYCMSPWQHVPIHVSMAILLA